MDKGQSSTCDLKLVTTFRSRSYVTSDIHFFKLFTSSAFFFSSSFKKQTIDMSIEKLQHKKKLEWES